MPGEATCHEQDSFSYTVQARCEPGAALRWLADLTRQGELHPLIVRVRQVPPGPGALPSYAITDRLAWGPLRFPATLPGGHAGDRRARTLVMRARQWPATTVLNHTRLATEPDGLVRIDVEITLTAPAPLFRYAFRQARAAHLGSPPGWARPCRPGPADGQ